jgi:hypothetical protein
MAAGRVEIIVENMFVVWERDTKNIHRKAGARPCKTCLPPVAILHQAGYVGAP